MTTQNEFQSPHGDSFFSDETNMDWMKVAQKMAGFNPLTGIRSFLTQYIYEYEYRHEYTVSIPSRGFVLF